VAPPVVKKVAPSSTSSEGARGSQPLRSIREEKPPRKIHWRSYFIGYQHMQMEKMAREIVQTHRESCFIGSMVLHDRWILHDIFFNQE
jgi:hypothetical protein